MNKQQHMAINTRTTIETELVKKNSTSAKITQMN